jgi:LmbE family N-acetylglucosaminyl deacetylase
MRILAIGAHLDDIELGCGGGTGAGERAGARVPDDLPLAFGLRQLRRHGPAHARGGGGEGRAAAEALGCGHLEVLDFPTKDIRDESRVVEAIDERIQAFGPDVIFTHWPFDTHQAHRGTGLATISAARRSNTILMYDPVFPSGRSFVGFRPQVYVDITDALEQKLESLRRHESQYLKYGDDWIDAVRARARFRGYEMGAEYGEAFEVVRMELSL